MRASGCCQVARIGWAVAALITVLMGLAAAPAWGAALEADRSVAGRAAPFFILPKLAGAGEAASDTLYDANAVTLIAFWTTHCAECTRRLERCNDLAAWGGPEGVGFISINWDAEVSTRALHQAESAAPRLLHLHDSGGRVAASFGAGAHSFSLYLVDPSGRLEVAYYEPTPGQIADLKGSLAARVGAEEDPAQPARPAQESSEPEHTTGARFLFDEWSKTASSKIQFSGRGRMRWMHVDTTGTGAVGANGEPLEPGASLRQRAELELAYQISPALSAGALLRVSNEGSAVLRSGPDYLSHESGSFFFKHTARGRLPLLGLTRSTLTGGYYRIALTPLTLMRWDQADTPISGGQRAQGCGVCGGDAGMAGFIRSESLEELGPDLSFEGARWALTLRDRFDLLTFYARPQTPHTANPLECASFDRDETYYLQQIYGGRLGTQFKVPWTVAPLEIETVALLIDEDEDQPLCDGTLMQSPPFRDRVLSVQLRVPGPGGLTVEAEGAASHWRPDKDEPCGQGCHTDGNALRIVVAQELRASEEGHFLGLSTASLRARVEAAYQEIESGFYSPYNALSYESNLRGLRGSARVDWGPLGCGVFYKRMAALRDLRGPSYAPEEDGTKSTASVWVDAEIWRGGVLMLGAVQDDRNLYEAGAVEEHLGPAQSDVFIMSFTQELAADCAIMVEATWLDGQWREGIRTGGQGRAVRRDYSSSIVRVLVDLEF